MPTGQQQQQQGSVSVKLINVDEKADPSLNTDEKDDSRSSDVTDIPSSSGYEDQDREKWDNKIEFILACVGFAVAYGNLMRFPYLCMRNGGGAFLIPFFFFMLLCGLPLYYLEVCLGQFSGSSPLFVWRLAPLLRGLGPLMVMISGIVCWYYNTILAWVLYYLVRSFSSILPWSTCDNAWNTPACRPSLADHPYIHKEADGLVVGGNNQSGALLDYKSENGTLALLSGNVSSAKEFWLYNVLGRSEGLDDVGSIQTHLALSLLGAWLLVFCCLLKGIKSVGKVVYVTAVLPYVLLFVFLIRGLTLPGAVDGLNFYLRPDFSKLLKAQVWLDAAVQVFYSLGPTWGGVITMASYNKFHNNCLRDSIIACAADAFTSFFGGFVVFPIIGYMAHELGQPIEEVATSGPGLMFIAYPEAISRMPLPQFWSVLFFIMLVTVGLDTQFGMFETLSSGIIDAFPAQLSKRRVYVTAVLTALLFLLGLPFTTNAGIYIYQLIDWYSSAICMCLGAFLELVAIAWYYGLERFSQDISLMLGYSLPIALRLCWGILSPTILLVTLLVMLVQYEDVTYENYSYPGYAKTIGLILALIPVIPVPVTFVYQLATTPGSLKQRIKKLLKPDRTWRPNERKYRSFYETLDQPHSSGPCDYVTQNLIGRGSRSMRHQMNVFELNSHTDL